MKTIETLVEFFEAISESRIDNIHDWLELCDAQQVAQWLAAGEIDRDLYDSLQEIMDGCGISLSVEIETGDAKCLDDTGNVYVTGTLSVTAAWYDGTLVVAKWDVCDCGYVAGSSSPHLVGTYVSEPATDGDDTRPTWLSHVEIDGDLDERPGVSDDDIESAVSDSDDTAYGEEPSEDSDGEWAVVGMDGDCIARYATASECHTHISRESAQFGRSTASIGGGYLPRSVCHVVCGEPRRDGQYSTGWSVGCTHETTTAER